LTVPGPEAGTNWICPKRGKSGGFFEKFSVLKELLAAKARGFTADGRSAIHIRGPGNQTHEASPGNIPNIILPVSRAFIG
jgi:hypothetical protein